MLNMSMMLGSDLWQTIIGWFGSWIVNYGWAIIVFTIALKLVMIPLDIFQRVSSQKQTRFMSIMQPEMQALQAKYGNDREKLNQEQAKLYKKYNVNVGGMCLTMLLTMGLSLVIFFTLFSGLNKIAAYKIYSEYETLQQVYAEEIGVCRTFVFFHELQFLFANNLVKGGDVDNAIVIVEHPVTEEQVGRISQLFNVPALQVREDGYLSNLTLRFPNECARHKMLDLIGDLRLCGGFLKAKVTAEKAGHSINTAIAKVVRSKNN